MKRLEKENQQLKNRIADLLEYIEELGGMAGVCTYNTTKEICSGCRCGKLNITKMLTANERALYDIFYFACRHKDGFVKESQRELAEQLYCSSSAISSGIRSLKSKGIISVKVQQGVAGMEVEILKELKIPNKETEIALKDSRSGKNLTKYKNLKDLIKDCLK